MFSIGQFFEYLVNNIPTHANHEYVQLFQWSNAEQEWSKIGEVVDAVGQNRKQLYGGIEYDHVFDIDVGEGVPALKLPFNVTENPYTAAQEFLTKHDLPPVYLDQVADFITKNARAVSQGAAAATGDPLTGKLMSKCQGGCNHFLEEKIMEVLTIFSLLYP